jgi:hypothetical protein
MSSSAKQRHQLADRHGPQHGPQMDLFEATNVLREPARADELPATARELVRMIGLDATIQLVQMFGGDELVMPQKVRGTSRLWDLLVEVIGEHAATRLVDETAGTRLYVPTCQAALLSERNREIARAYDAGEHFDAIRRRYKVSRRHLWRLLKKG